MSVETVRFAVVIPAYRPEESLLQLIATLAEKPIPAIVLVDDGSGPDYREIFRRAEAFDKVRLVRHAVNLGKGAALKTAFNYALCAFPELQGVVTADADGQHHPDDIQQVADALAAEPDRIVLGARTFSADVPLRSRVGNIVTRTVMAALVGQRVSDTQTGLRGIPASLLPQLLRLEANGYDFELDMLIAIRQRAMRIAEVPIRTIYEPGNRTSHFNPLIDSMKIYFVLLRFSSVSMMTAALDTLVFYLAYRRLGNVAASQALGRLVAVAFNYSMVRRAVFFSKLRHASVLPEYLLLVCLSGLTSYAGIQLLNSRFHIQLLPAKLLVETLLFFANFAIQRDFIFGRSPKGSGPQGAAPSWISGARSWIPRALLAGLALLSLWIVWHGFRVERMWPNSNWTPVGRFRFVHYTKEFWAASLAILLLVPGVYAPFAVLLVAVATVIALGPLPLLAVAVFLIASCALGSTLLGSSGESSPENQLCATMLGIAVYIFLMTFLARLPVNYPAVYLALLAIPVLLDWRGVGRRLVSWAKALALSRKYSRPQAAAFALLVFVLGMHWFMIPQPESSADGLAMHLAIPVDISLHHVFTYMPGRVLWSVMPMGADWCYTMVYLLGGEFAARLLNFAMLLLVEALLYRAARRFVGPAIGFVLLALFASTPLVQLVTGSVFIENFLAAVVAGMVVALWQFGETGQRRYLYAAAVIGGTALSIKLGGLAYVVAALPVVAIEVRRRWALLGPRPALISGIAAALLLAAALPPYVISWKMTGDPVYPFLNQTFPSPLVDRTVSFVDPRYKQPIAFREPYDLTFHTDHYGEGRPGSLGFHYLLLVPLGVAGLVVVRRRPAWIAAVVSIGGGLIVLKLLPNDRYLYPSLPLLLVPLAALLGWLAPSALRYALVVLAVASVLLNSWFMPSSNYYHRDFYEKAPLSRASRQAYIDQYSQIREIGQYMNRAHAGSPVFLADGSDLAAFNAEVYTNNWHQFNVFARVQRARDARDIAAILDRWKVHYIVAPKPILGVTLYPVALRDLLQDCVAAEYQTAWLFVAHIDGDCQQDAGLDRQPLTVPPGWYDDSDPAIVYRGLWTHDKGWPQARYNTVTFSNSPGSKVRFAFQGSTLVYVYTQASNRGMADVAIDGVHHSTLDLYSPNPAWQSRTVFKLGAGRHLAVIAVLPDKNPVSSGQFIDVDAFEVH